MIGKTAEGAWTCAEHPELVTADEREAVEHLRAEHPGLVAFLSTVQITPLVTRADRRRAAREADRSATFGDQRRARSAHN